MKLALDLTKTARQNAQHYFEQAKRVKHKMKGAEDGLKEVEAKIAALEKESAAQRPKPLEKRRAKEWFEKFRWCYTRNGFLVIGGKDAHSNEALVKRHMEEKDWYFHADTFGAPHCVLKTEGKKPAREDFEDAAAFAGLFSSIWKKGALSVRVYRVAPSQVSKKAPAGESLGKGAFMIYGERQWYDPVLRLGWGVQEAKDGTRILCGPLVCVQPQAEHVMEIVPGEKSKAEIAKSYQRTLLRSTKPVSISLDELIAALPVGEFRMKPVNEK